MKYTKGERKFRISVIIIIFILSVIYIIKSDGMINMLSNDSNEEINLGLYEPHSGGHVGGSKTPSPSPSSNTSSSIIPEACYKSKKTTSSKDKNELKWTNDSSWGDKTNIKKAKCKNCYANAATLNEATTTIFATERDAANPYFIDGITNADACKPGSTFCDPQPYASPASQTKAASKCEDTVSLKYNDGKTCNGKGYYSITCENNISVSFDNGHDESKGNSISTINETMAGLGFEFGMKISTTYSCTYTFNETFWKDSYKAVALTSTISLSGSSSSSSAVISSNSTSSGKLQVGSGSFTTITDQSGGKLDSFVAAQTEEQKNKIEQLKKYVTDYNNYKKDSAINIDNIKASLNIDGYKVSGKAASLGTSDFVAVKVSSASGQKTNIKNHDLGVSGLTNPQSYIFSSTTPEVIEVYFAKTYLDRSTGAMTKNTSGLQGGNKLYVDSNASAGTYSMNVQLKINDNRNITVTNNQCKLKINKDNIKYRPIEVKNPFINSSWKKGENWINNIFSFTSAIHGTTWSESTYNRIVIRASDIKAIKASNKTEQNQNNSPYLGLCGRINSNLQDSITKKLCSCISNKNCG